MLFECTPAGNPSTKKKKGAKEKTWPSEASILPYVRIALILWHRSFGLFEIFMVHDQLVLAHKPMPKSQKSSRLNTSINVNVTINSIWLWIILK